jgi:stage III sporulation protein AE
MINVNNYLYNDCVKDLKEDFSAILPEGYEELGELSGARLGIERILLDLMTELAEGKGRIGEFFLSLLGAAILLALIGRIRSPLSEPISRGSSAIVGAGVIAMLYPLFSGVVESLAELGKFFSALAPILTAFLAFGGGEGSAVSSSYLLSLTVWITGLVDGGLLLPVVGAVIGTSAIAYSLGGPATAIASTVKNIFSRSVALVGALLGGVFALQTFVTASVDNATLRAMRYAVSGLVPIVGSTVSGAMSTIVGGLSGVGGIIGASSVAVILSIALAPLVYLLLYRLAFALAAFVTDMLGGEATDTVKGLAGSLDVLISVYVMTTIIYIFEIIVVILGGNMIFGGA